MVENKMRKNKQRKTKKDKTGFSEDISQSTRHRPPPIEVGDFNDMFVNYYKFILTPTHLTEAEFERMIAIYRTPHPNVFRLSTNFEQYHNIEQEMNEYFTQLRSDNVTITEYNYFPPKYGRIFKISLDKATLKREPKFRPFRNWLNFQTELGRTHRQEFVSMIPTYFLDIKPTDSVLDLCASPGSKTSQIAEILDKEDGFVIANDIDIRRCRTLVHNLQKIGTQNILITCQKAQFFEVENSMSFDKVLCDVPCTGDGTLRKKPAVGKNWTPKKGADLHGTQRAILKRGLELTKIDGFCVYSTCSMNPIENESVVNSVLLETDGAVEIVDCSSLYPELKRHNGLTNWNVYDFTNNEIGEIFENFESVPIEKREKINQTMFDKPQVSNLKDCMRFYPFDDDSGGFFVAVLHKIRDFKRISRIHSNPQQPLREAPYVNMTQKGNKSVLESIKDVFGLDENFPYNQIFVRNEKSVNNISYLSRKVADLINKFGSEKFFTVSCGSPIFTWRNFSKGLCSPYPAIEGVHIVLKYAHKRVFKFKPNEIKLLLLAGHNGLKFTELSEETFLQMKDGGSNGALFYIPDTQFAYGGMTLKASCTAYLRKDLLPIALKNLILAYPELADKEDIKKIDDDDDKSEEKEKDNDND